MDVESWNVERLYLDRQTSKNYISNYKVQAGYSAN